MSASGSRLPRHRIRLLLRHPATAGLLAAAALFGFLWPFLRDPPPGLARAWLELFAVWTLMAAALWALSRHQRPGGEGGRGEGDG